MHPPGHAIYRRIIQNQALRAIELGMCKDNTPNLFSYEQYYLEHLLNSFTINESSWTFCHPKMQFLLDYDKEHHSELAYTVYMYLILSYEMNRPDATDQ